jgi:predicted transcriptional regulator YdeE
MGSKLIKFTVQAFPKSRVIGKSVVMKEPADAEDRSIENLWESIERDGSLDFLYNLPHRFVQAHDSVGWMGDFKPGADRYTYLAGVLFEQDTPVPEGFVYRDVEACEMAYGWIQETDDDQGGDIHGGASQYISRAVAEHGYQYDGSHGLFEMEYYSEERLRKAKERGEKEILDFYSPCKKSA